jgi:hypothetical protein
MHLVFVHGMRQEGKIAADLQRAWEKALLAAWSAAGLEVPQYTLEMPYYGDVLSKLTMEVRGTPRSIVVRGEAGSTTFSPLEEAIIRRMAAEERISDEEVRADIGQEIVARGPANWEWVQGLARVLERKVPGLGGLGMGFVRQVDAYLTRDHIQEAVDAIVAPCMSRGRTVVVAHSLGTIVTYRLLRNAKTPVDVPLLVTLGSPLAITEVKQYLKPPSLQVPKGVAKWLNGTDERDYVALYARLDRDTFADGIENLSDLHNGRSDAHSIVDYLSDKVVSRSIHTALLN